MSISVLSRVGSIGLLLSVFFLVGAGVVVAKPICDKTVCAESKAEAMSLAARSCGWGKDFAGADCTCLNSGGDCGKSSQGKKKSYLRCSCGIGKGRSIVPEKTERKGSRCFDRVKRIHESDGDLAAQLAALKCVGLPVKAERLKVLLGPKPGAVVLVVSPSFAERSVLKLTLNKQHVLDVIPNVVRIEVDPHVRRLKVRSNGVGFTLTDLLK